RRRGRHRLLSAALSADDRLSRGVQGAAGDGGDGDGGGRDLLPPARTTRLSRSRKTFSRLVARGPTVIASWRRECVEIRVDRDWRELCSHTHAFAGRETGGQTQATEERRRAADGRGPP